MVLRKEALYQKGDFETHRYHDLAQAAMHGDTTTLHYTEENFGIRLPTEEEVQKALAKMEKEDPYNVRSLILLKSLETEDEKERRRIEGLADKFEALPIKARAGSPAAKNILCQALHNQSYFSYPHGKSPIDKFFE